MDKRDRAVLKQFAAAVRVHFPEAEIWAFGSRVRGCASEYSDLDVCVIVDDYNEVADKKIMETAWATGFDNDIVISTVAYSKEQFRNGALSSSPFVKSILAQGIAA
jgi:predicted nucleotidyltransferase